MSLDQSYNRLIPGSRDIVLQTNPDDQDDQDDEDDQDDQDDHLILVYFIQSRAHKI